METLAPYDAGTGGAWWPLTGRRTAEMAGQPADLSTRGLGARHWPDRVKLRRATPDEARAVRLLVAGMRQASFCLALCWAGPGTDRPSHLFTRTILQEGEVGEVRDGVMLGRYGHRIDSMDTTRL